MLTYAQVNGADLSGIQQAAQEWRRLKAAYEGLGDRYENQVRRRLQQHWEGKAATEAGHTVAKNKEQISAAAGEAGRMSKLLDDIHHDLDEHKKKLRKFADGLAEQHLQIDAQGQITDHHPTKSDRTAQHDADYDKWLQGRNQLIQQKYGELQQLLKAATEADTAAAASLRADNNGEDDHTFNKDGHQTLDEAVKAQQDAQHASDLLKQGRRLSPTQIDELSTLLEKNGQDPVFAQKFAQQTGARGTLDNYMTLMNPPPTDGRASKAQLQRLQKSLGTTLGTATQINDPAMDKFQRDLLAENGQHFDRHSGPGGRNSLQGYQITASLMRHGEWDDETLKSFGHDLVKYENDKVNFLGSGRESDWPLNTHDYGLIGQDPMSGFMDGLGHNPDAATDFLSGKTTGTDDGDIDNLDYLLKDREWHGGDGDKGHLGNALHAATTGHPYDQPPENPPPPRTQEQADLMGRVVKDVAENQDLASGPLSDGLGKMGAEYMADLNRGLYLDKHLDDKIMPIHGAEVPLREHEAARFMYAVGSDPEGNAALHLGQQQYAAQLISYHGHNPEAYDLPPKEKMEQISRVVGNSEGIIATARSDEILREGIEKDKEFNDALESGGKFAEGVISVGGAGLGAVGGGGVGAAAGGAAGAEAGKLVIGGIVDAAKQDTSMPASWDAAGEYNQHQSQTHQNITNSLERAGVHPPPGISEDEWRTAIKDGVEDGYGLARDDVDSYATNRPEEAEK
ncbi:DUF6571 family protein [Streptomyces marispadix]|uniref:AG2 protein n=1 Tax=Streptomyces marispadix TaxID=2922868 RepID=A0ABS9T119_9ACTN|nr:DUF6571 family protein [Streptomyces marispadix]MCH6162230.1 hypothetical protein [Streptomyces marispadix]